MSHEVVMTGDTDRIARSHLLQHYERGIRQEDLCFALWRPSTGRHRTTAIVHEIVLPARGDRRLHGNASFEPDYLTRALLLARSTGSGIALLHSHPTPGWQAMSHPDVLAERDALSYPAGATGLPFVGLTVGTDGYWSARFWIRQGATMARHWCAKVRIVGPKRYQVYCNDTLVPPPPRRRVLKRTFDTWGKDAQDTIARLHVGIVGLGSVGSVVAEAVARMGVARVTLIDPDHVEEHNLDRLLFGTPRSVGRPKVTLAARSIRNHSTAHSVRIVSLPMSVHDAHAYRAALDCDVLFSCVDRPLARDVLNYIACAHLIPVIDGGVAVEYSAHYDRLLAAHWRAHIVTPYHECLRCNGQYSSGMVVVELDGSLDDPSYVANLPSDQRNANQNVFPFSLSAAAMEINLMLRYMLSEDWWPLVRQQDYQFVAAETRNINNACHAHCSFRDRRGLGDIENPPYLASPRTPSLWSRLRRKFTSLDGI